MGSMFLGSVPNSSFTIIDGSCWRGKRCIKNYYASPYYITKASWRNKTQKIQNEEHHILRHRQRINLKHNIERENHTLNAAFGESSESDSQANDSKTIWDSTKHAFNAFYRFSRPHTVIGTVLSIISMSLLAVEKLSDLSPAFFIGVSQAIVAGVFMNIYVVGLNQLYDLEIDKINKPYLPLASGEYSFTTGVLLIASSVILSFWLGWIVGSWPLLCFLFAGFIIGTAYSIDFPLLRWKKSPALAAMSVVVGRTIVVQLAFFLHIQSFVYKRPAMFPRPLIFSMAFVSFFSLVIAMFKDIPDIDGDNISGIRTFSVRLGQKRIFWLCVSLLEMAYGISVIVGATSPFLWSKILTITGHAILGCIVWYRAKNVDLKSNTSITSFYMFIWKLFYAEYLLIPMVR